MLAMRFDGLVGIFGTVVVAALSLPACAGPVMGGDSLPAPPSWLVEAPAAEQGQEIRIEGRVTGIYPGRRALEVLPREGSEPVVFVLPEDPPPELAGHYARIVPDDEVQVAAKLGENRQLLLTGIARPDG